MAMRIAILFSLSESKISAFKFTLTKPNVAAVVFSRPISKNFTSQHTGKDVKAEYQEFQKWCNGGGLFHKYAFIDPSARIDIGALVHSDSVVGANVYVGSGSFVGPNVTIGQSTRTGSNVVLRNCTIGDFCVIHHGVCIGQDGFEFFVDEQGLMVKKPQGAWNCSQWHSPILSLFPYKFSDEPFLIHLQCLKARIGNCVEIGANTCIDRGRSKSFVSSLADRSQRGNRDKLYVMWTSRSCRFGDVRLAANSCVTKNICEAGDYGGSPAVPIHEWRKQVASVRQTSKEFWHSKKKKFA